MKYTLVINHGDKANSKTEIPLTVGASKKGTYATLSVEGNKAVPFGKLYVDEKALAKKS